MANTPSKQAAIAAKQRGIVQTRRGYNSQAVQTHPNDRYVRVFPDGPFDQSWQGVQKIIGRIMPGTHRQGGFWDPRDGTTYATRNFKQSTKSRSGTINFSNAASRSVGGGPASIAAQQQYYADQANANPGLFQTLIAKLRGR